MTGPDPQVSTAPAEGASSGSASPAGRLRPRRLPSHIGHARTSTVILAVAFVAIGVLYLFVKPPEPADAAGGTRDATTATSEQRESTTQAPRTSSSPPTAPTSESAPTTSEEPPETEPDEETTEAPTESPEDPETAVPEETEENEDTAPEPVPTTGAPTP